MENFINFLTASYDFLVKSWGLTIALIGFVSQKFFIPQILEFRSILKRARYDVIYYANVAPFKNKSGTFINESELNDAHKELRVISSKIRACREDIPCYKLVSLTRIVPSFENTEIAAVNFIGWSNDIFEINPEAQSRQRRRKAIGKALGMKHI
jgi:hypothetical protein